MKRSAPPPLPQPAPAERASPPPQDASVISPTSNASLAELAMQLRDEQLEARVVHYKADLATSPELDKITAQVVAELYQLQQAMRSPSQPPPPLIDKAQLAAELTRSLSDMLGRLFRPDKVASIIERKVAEASKRFARLFFESELHEKIRGSSTEVKTMRFPEQALFHVFARNETYLKRQLEAFDYVDAGVRDRAKEQLARLMRELRDGFLSKTTPELNSLVKLLNEVLIKFFTQKLPNEIDSFAAEVVNDGRLAHARVRAGYKISSDAFPPFRKAFERSFVTRLVAFAEAEMRKGVRATQGKYRTETIRFVSDPQIFSDVCELICDAVYDYLYNDGFLDLPGDWRARLLDG